MRRMTPQNIRDTFNAQKDAHETAWAKSGLTGALESLSLALRDLNMMGIDATLEMMSTPSEQAFAMLPDSGMTVPVSGLLRIGHIHYLLSIATKHGGQDCLKLCLSEFDIRFQGVKGKIQESDFKQSVRSNIYDLQKDADAMVKFQKEIIRHAARNDVIDAHDVGATLDTGTPRKKTGLKSALKKPANG